MARLTEDEKAAARRAKYFKRGNAWGVNDDL